MWLFSFTCFDVERFLMLLPTEREEQRKMHKSFIFLVLTFVNDRLDAYVEFYIL